MALPEELEFEIEALHATYGEDEVEVQGITGEGSNAGTVVALAVTPRTDAEHERYVAARLVLSLGPAYPSHPPRVQLSDTKGLSDQRLARVQAALEGEAASLAGELQLGHLCESAIDLLTAANQPEGGCAFCLELLLPAAAQAGGGESGDGGDGSSAVLRLGCYHCYHMSCFAPWWQWQQRRLAQREAQLWGEYKSMAPPKLEEEGIRREGLSGSRTSGEEAAAFVLTCPACRAEVAPASLAHAWQQLQAATTESWSSGGGRAALQELPQRQRQQLQAMQRRHAAVMRRQQECGGLVEAHHSVSLSDLQQAATAAMAAAEATTIGAPEATVAAGGSPCGGPSGCGGRGLQQHSRRGDGRSRHSHHGRAGSGGRHAGRGRGREGVRGRGGGGRQL